MQPDLTCAASARSALVLGGTGAIGSAVLRQLAARGVPTTFTYHQREDRARALAGELDQRAVHANLASAGSAADLLAGLEASGTRPDVLIHCAGVGGWAGLDELTVDTWRELVAVNAEAALWTVQWLARRARGDVDVVLVGALDRAQSLPLPVAFAASQGMLPALAMALAHELGPRGFRVNVVALGVMEEGMSTNLASERRRDYEKFSALRRAGRPDEAAAAITWLALDNRYINGKTIPVNGGIG